MALYSAARVRAKARAAVKRREDQVEQEEAESGELNLIPYLDMVTNLMLFILASVSAGIILVQIDTTLPDKKAPSATPTPPKPADEQPLELFVSVKLDSTIIWSVTGLEGTLSSPKASFPRIGTTDGSPCQSDDQCETDKCSMGRCVANPGTDPTPAFDYRALNKALFEIADRRYKGKLRKFDTYHATIQADPSIPYATVASVMAAMRCKFPENPLEEVTACMIPNEDKTIKAAAKPITDDKKYFDTDRVPYDATTMSLFHDIRFSSGFEK